MQSKNVVALLDKRIKEKKPIYRLVLMDFAMPEVDGCECANQIRHFISSKGFAQPAIVCLTAYTETQFRDKALAAGMDEVAVKPVFKKKMQQILARYHLIQ